MDLWLLDTKTEGNKIKWLRTFFYHLDHKSYLRRKTITCSCWKYVSKHSIKVSLVMYRMYLLLYLEPFSPQYSRQHAQYSVGFHVATFEKKWVFDNEIHQQLYNTTLFSVSCKNCCSFTIRTKLGFKWTSLMKFSLVEVAILLKAWRAFSSLLRCRWYSTASKSRPFKDVDEQH